MTLQSEGWRGRRPTARALHSRAPTRRAPRSGTCAAPFGGGHRPTGVASGSARHAGAHAGAQLPPPARHARPSRSPGGPSYSARLLLQAYSPIPPAEVEPAADAKGSSAGAYSAEARVRLAAAPPTLPCARPIRRPLRLWLARAPQSPPWLRGAFLPACRSRCSSGSSRRRSAKMPPWPLP